AYRVFIVSVASFVAQLDPLPAAFDLFEKRLIHKLFPGPADWLPGDVLRNLKQFGFPRDFPDVAHIASVAKVWVVLHEARQTGGLQ
ncbi:unnamed protein product, partial [Prorocentrum cordatum]